MAGDTVKYRSGEADGATAVGHEFDTQASLVTAGAKILSIKNAGVEKLAISKDGEVLTSGAGGTWVVRPAEGGAGIQTALTAAITAGGGVIQLLAGTYVLTSGIGGSNPVNITIQGLGEATILDIQGIVGTAILFNGGSIVEYGANAVTAGDTSVYTTTAANAGNFLAGDTVVVDIRKSTGEIFHEVHEVLSNGVAGTGEIPIVGKIFETGDIAGFVTRQRSSTGKNLAIRDLRITHSTGASGNVADITGIYGLLLENLKIDASGGTYTGSALQPLHCLHAVIRGCILEHMTGTAGVIRCGQVYHSSIRDNVIRNCGSSSVNVRPIWIDYYSSYITVQGNHIYNNRSNNADFAAIDLTGTSGTVMNNVIIDSNTIYGNINMSGIKFAISNRIVVSDNVVFLDPTVGALGRNIESGSNNRNIVISGNTLRYGVHGIDTQNTESTDWSIIGNVIIDCGSSGGSGINITHAKNMTISGNTIKRGAGGISANGSADRVNISNNTISDTTGFGIDLSGTATRCIISGNIAYNCTGNEIQVGNTAVDNLIIGNNIAGGAISEGTGSNTFANNLL